MGIRRTKFFVLLIMSALAFLGTTNFVQAATVVRYVDEGVNKLNVRSGPGTNYKKVGELGDFTKTKVYGVTKTGWAEIRYKKKKAYVSNEYLVNISLKKTRVKRILKDEYNKKYTVYVIFKNEKTAKATFNSTSWNVVWAGANPGDLMYKGDYTLFLRKSGSNHIKKTEIGMTDYIYNKTRKMIYSIPSKYKGQPSIFAIAEAQSSNIEKSALLTVFKGKLNYLGDIDYTYRLKNIAKNEFQTATYDNSIGKWYVDSYKLFLKDNELYHSNSKIINKVNTWRKDWK